ncbi:MAG: DNA repair protein RadC [Chloroflexi bacterium]|nr:DNA repair protein RadC [Chloroflexota bacterium]
MDYTLRIRDLPASERPRERLRDAGPNALSNAELLAILLRTGTASESALALASRLLARHDGLAGLARTTFRELCAEHGLGEAKAAQVQAGLELGRRLLALHPEERAIVRNPADAANLLRAEMGLLEQEHLRVVLLNTKNRVLGVSEVYKGNVNSSVVRTSEIFRDAIRENCPAVIVVHNHPSGDPTPSPEDVQMTRRIVEAGKLLDIEVLDHLIIAGNTFISLREKKLGFE